MGVFANMVVLLLSEKTSASYVDADAIEMDGKVYRRMLCRAVTHETTAGRICADPWLCDDHRRPKSQGAGAIPWMAQAHARGELSVPDIEGTERAGD